MRPESLPDAMQPGRHRRVMSDGRGHGRYARIIGWLRAIFGVGGALMLLAAGWAGACPGASADDVAAQLSAPASPLLDERALAEATVMQSAGFDPAGRQWYFTQLAPHAETDLVITKISQKHWKGRGHMTLRNFGHGVAVGVEPDPDGGAWLYVESHPKSSSADSLCEHVGTQDCLESAEVALGSGDGKRFGTMISRFHWHAGRTITVKSSGVQTFAVNNHAPQQTAVVDWATKTIAVRFWSMRYGRFRIGVYDLDSFKDHHYKPLARFDAPKPTTVMQGWGYSAGVVYRVEGHRYADFNPAPGDTTLTAFEADGLISTWRPETAGADLTWREPEGAAVADGRLCIGFASGEQHHRKANLYCK